jgi:RNA polymerase sigma-70 factor, ECF subfamily
MFLFSPSLKVVGDEMNEAFKEERHLILALASGREDAFAFLYDNFGTTLFKMAFRITRNREEAEDAVQNMFAGVARNRTSLTTVKNFRAYLFTCLRNAAATISTQSARNRSAIKRVGAEVSQGTQSKTASEISRQPLAEYYDRLPAQQRDVLSMKIDGGLTFEAIGQILEISANTAASRYRYGLEKIRSALGAKL